MTISNLTKSGRKSSKQAENTGGEIARYVQAHKNQDLFQKELNHKIHLSNN